MPKPTTRDLAAAAGVRIATVDRVLTRREGLRQKTIDQVNDAIREIDRVRDLAAATLARKRPFDLVFLLPAREDAFLSPIVRAIEEAAAALAHARVSARVVGGRERFHEPGAPAPGSRPGGGRRHKAQG
jgi:LacI family transcriptional regulator